MFLPICMSVGIEERTNNFHTHHPPPLQYPLHQWTKRTKQNGGGDDYNNDPTDRPELNLWEGEVRSCERGNQEEGEGEEERVRGKEVWEGGSEGSVRVRCEEGGREGPRERPWTEKGAKHVPLFPHVVIIDDIDG